MVYVGPQSSRWKRSGTGAGSAPSACRDIFPQKVRKSKNVITADVILNARSRRDKQHIPYHS